MTSEEAYYVLAHREMYDQETYNYALTVVEDFERQGGIRRG